MERSEVLATVQNWWQQQGDVGTLLMLTLHGSTLYGTNTPESDIDVKGIFVPHVELVLTGKAPSQLTLTPDKGKDEKNKAGDLEITVYSVQKFMRMLQDGETIAIDLLHSIDSQHALLFDSNWWINLTADRQLFYTKDMQAFMGYCRKQAAKYGMKGSRLAGLQAIYDFMEKPAFVIPVQYNPRQNPGALRLALIWDQLPVNEYCYFVEKLGVQYYSVLGSLYQSTMPVDEFRGLIQAKWEQYGERARLAMQNEGVDWKAMSHALRAALQLKDIYKDSKITYPFDEGRANFLKDVKQGKLPFSEVSDQLDTLIREVETLAAESTYSGAVDELIVDNHILSAFKTSDVFVQ